MVQNISLQNSYSSSHTGIKETESLYGPYLNCGHFPYDIRFIWSEPLESKLHLAATGSPPSSREVGLQSSPAIAESTRSPCSPSRDRQETGEDIGKTYSLCAWASVHPWSILRVNGRIGAIDEFCTSHCKVRMSLLILLYLG